MKKKKLLKLSGIIALAAFVTGGALLLPRMATVQAADVPVTTTIQAAIDAANPGDRVVIPAGTYDESFNVYNKTGLTIYGDGAVIINSQPDHPAPGDPQKGINVVNSENVTIQNVIVDGTATNQATGIDATGVPGFTLDNVTVRNFEKNGIAITAFSTASAVETSSPALETANVTFNNVTVENTGWAGIAFYGIDFTGGDTQYDIPGVVFTGETHISGTEWGIQFGDNNDAVNVTGPGGNPVNLGVVHFANNTQHISNDQGNVAILLSANSTVNGNPATLADFPGNLNLTLVESDTPVVPGVPNTGDAS